MDLPSQPAPSLDETLAHPSQSSAAPVPPGPSPCSSGLHGAGEKKVSSLSKTSVLLVESAGNEKAKAGPIPPFAPDNATSIDRTLQSRGPNAAEVDDPATAKQDETLARPDDQDLTHPTAFKPANNVGVAGYEILGTLGRGGMGVVYKARHLALNRITALKMILSGAHADQEEIARFRTEAEAVARLQHPNIVQIYEVGERNGLPFFSLEYVDGGSLQAKMSGNPLKPAFAAQVVSKLARAMHYAHQRGIVHRDIKPANILLTSDGTPKITDFGLAKRLEAEGGHTATGSILGTPSYMSPEQACGKVHEIGPASDVYSLGAMLYEMLAGRPPFRGETLLHTLQLVQTSEALPPSRLQPRIPQDLETICLRCLQKEPHKRFSTAEELADDIDRFLAGQPIKARRTPLLERAWKWVKRRPGVAALLAILAIVIVGGFFGMFGLWLNAESERSSADAARADAVEKEKIARAAAVSEAEAKLEAQRNYERATRILYATHMSLAQKALSDGHFGRALELLREMATPRDGGRDLRGFEWYYLERLCKADRLALMGHTNLVTDVVFSRDAKRLATASLDQKVKIWDVDKGQVLLTLTGHRRPVRAVVFSDDGKLLATASADGTVKIWNAVTGANVHTLAGHADRVQAVAFSADGKLLASGSEDRTIILWDVASGKALRTLKGHEYGVTTVAFNRSATMLASGGEDKLVLLWDLAADKPPEPIQGHGHWVTCVVFDGPGKRLASASLDETVIVWDVAKRERLRTLTDAKKPIRFAAFSPGGSQLAAQSMQGDLFVWDLTVDEPPKVLQPQPGLLRTITFSGDGERLGAVEFDTRLWDPNSVLKGHKSAVTGVAFDPQGKLFASAGGFLDDETRQFLGEVKLWDLAGHKVERTLLGHKGPVRTLAFSKDGKLLLTGSEDNTVRLWDVNLGTTAKMLTGHSGWVNCVAFSPDDNLAASAGQDNKAILWDLRTGQKTELVGHTRSVRCVAFSPDGKTLATGAAGGAVKLWDVARCKELKTIDAHDFTVTCVAFSPDGQSLATASEDQVIKLWYLTGKSDPLQIKGHTDTVTAIVFGDGGKRLFSASADQAVKVWDTETGEEMLTLHGHTGGVTSIAIAPSGRRLASGSWDQTVRVWDASASSK